MNNESKYVWRITNRNTGGIVESEPSYQSKDEALRAARKFASREYEGELEIPFRVSQQPF